MRVKNYAFQNHQSKHVNLQAGHERDSQFKTEKKMYIR